MAMRSARATAQAKKALLWAMAPAKSMVQASAQKLVRVSAPAMSARASALTLVYLLATPSWAWP